MHEVALANLTFEQVEAAVKDDYIAIFPTGSTEQHGRHLPLNTDWFLALSVAKEAASRFGRALVTPPLPFGYAQYYLHFPGSISLRTETLIRVVQDVVSSLFKTGFNKVLVLNGHGGNRSSLSTAVASVRDEAGPGKVAAVTSYFDLARDEITKYRQSATGGMSHSGELETSLQMYLSAGLVHKDKIEKNMPPSFIGDEVSWDLTQPTKAELFTKSRQFMSSGVCGDPTLASREKGQQLFEAIVGCVVKFLEKMDHLVLEN